MDVFVAQAETEALVKKRKTDTDATSTAPDPSGAKKRTAEKLANENKNLKRQLANQRNGKGS